MGILNKFSSAVYNSIVGGLEGFTSNINISLQQLEDEIVETRLFVMKKYAMQNQLPVKDLYYSINCIETDCKSLSKCCLSDEYDVPQLHFEIPQIFTDAKDASILYIGSVDKNVKFKVYTDPTVFKYHKYKIRGSKKPYIYIDITPNENNKLDCYIFNAPFLERLTVQAIFKDIRDLEDYVCCQTDLENFSNSSWIDTEVKDTLIKKYVQYYRQLYQQPQPNNQVPK